MAASTEPTTAAEQHSDQPWLERLGPDDVIRCRNDEAGGVTWYFAVRDGRVWQYHEWHGFEARPVFPRQVAAMCAPEEVDVAIVSRRHLETLRGEGGGE